MNSSKINAVVTNLLEQYLCSGDYQGVRNLAQDERFKTCCMQDVSEILNLLMAHLTQETFRTKQDLYLAVETLLKVTAEFASVQDMTMELLERLDNVKEDSTLISLMKALKVVLLRQPERKSLSIEWCLMSLLNYFKRLPCPAEYQEAFDVTKSPFLESNEMVDRMLQLHLILLLFLEPLVKRVVAERLQDYRTRTLENTRQNVLIHFLLNMLGTHVNRLYVPFEPKAQTNTYLRQCRETLTKMLTELLGSDPFFLLPFIEQRIRYPIAQEGEEEEDDVRRDMKKTNVFLLPHKTSVLNYGHYFHTLLVHQLAPADMPKIYKREFVFSKFMYLVTEMLKARDENVQMKGLEMGHKLLLLIGDGEGEGEKRLGEDLLELSIFEAFFDRIIQLMTYSENEQLRKSAVRYSETMILSFSHRGRLIILENLFQQYADNRGVSGYLPILYKNMVLHQLNAGADELPSEYTGKVFQRVLLRFICHLQDGEKTNILDSCDRILAALNMIRFIAIRDRQNKTTFWDVRRQLEEQFLEKLRLAIDLSRAHYLQYKRNIEMGVDVVEQQQGDVSLSMYGEEMPELSMDQKLVAMNNCLNSFDLMDSLLARANECIQAGVREK